MWLCSKSSQWQWFVLLWPRVKFRNRSVSFSLVVAIACTLPTCRVVHMSHAAYSRSPLRTATTASVQVAAYFVSYSSAPEGPKRPHLVQIQEIARNQHAMPTVQHRSS